MQAQQAQLVSEIKNRLNRIGQLAQEIEDVPNLLPDIWTMKGIDKKCQEIKQHVLWIEERLDWGMGGTGTGWSMGTGKDWR